MRDEIVERLGLRDPLVIVRGFDRPNIHLAVESFHEADAKRAALLDAVAEAPKPGIVYAATARSAARRSARQPLCRKIVARSTARAWT